MEFQALWDIPEMMMQAGAWPLSPSLGREWHVPGPSSEDGLARPPRDEARSEASLALVADMLAHLGKFAEEGVEAMRLPAFWHPRCTWYGPSGIGTCRGIEGFPQLAPDPVPQRAAGSRRHAWQGRPLL